MKKRAGIEVRQIKFSEVQEVVQNDPQFTRTLDPSSEYYGVIADGKIVSFGDLSFNGDMAYVSVVYTMPEYRNKGYHLTHLKHRIEVARKRGAKVMRATVIGQAYNMAVEAGYKLVQSPIPIMELKLSE